MGQDQSSQRAPASALSRGRPEQDWTRAVIDLAELYGWWGIHTPDSRHIQGTIIGGQNTAIGWPDWILFHPTRLQLGLVELKAARGRLARRQARWLIALAQLEPLTGGRVWVAIWRPDNLDSVRRRLSPGDGP